MVNVGSLPVDGNRLFDLDTQAGITALLLAVRGSELHPEEKNDIRDLVFLYANGGKDQSVRLSLEQKITALKLVPITPKTLVEDSLPKREHPTIGTFRNAPSFAIPSAPAPVPTPTTPPPVAVSTPPVAAPTPLFSQASPVATVVEDTEPLAAVVVPSVATPKAGQQQYVERIREIKAVVNEKVGNPVNLVDINNEVGREYMSALLDAMKRINSGMSADSAMQRLEAAFRAVEVTLENVESSAATSAVVPKEPDIPPLPKYTPPQPVPQPVFRELQTSEPQQEPAVPPVPHVPYQAVDTSTQVYSDHPVVPTPSYAAPAPTVHTPTPHTFSSLADMVQQSHAQAGLPTTPVSAPVLQSGDPLLSPEVEDGLSQLLSEWSIFKKSGIFGTGPKGREHPLYKKMAELQIPLLLAGRFEGATQEVRQSLTDYMNGWRYEQGLIYEKGETFEHYLRRVIRQILDQNNR